MRRVSRTGGLAAAASAATGVAVAFALALAPAAGAATTVDLSKFRKLRDVTKGLDVAVLRPLLDRGEVALIEHLSGAAFSQISIFALVDAPPAKVQYVVAHPEEFPKFVPNVAKSALSGASPDGTEFDIDYSIEVPLMNMDGRNHTKVAPDYVEIWGTSGDLREGHWIYRFVPVDGGSKTLLAYTGYNDPRKAGAIFKKLVDENPILEAGINCAGGMVLVRAVKRRALELAGRKPPIPVVSGKIASLHSMLAGDKKIDAAAVTPFLKGGELALIESNPDGSLMQGSMIAVINKSIADTYAVVGTPEKYSEFVPHVTESKLVKTEGDSKFIAWRVTSPVGDVKFENKFRGWPAKRTHLVATGGDIKVGAWGWELRELTPTSTFAVYYNYADLRGGGFVLRKMIETDPSFEHGLNVANSLTMMLAVKKRVEGP
ncbi:MAG TPA: SRPBCC family protein [Myxococcota bacterium]|jgi:ribosome-associated toxin RatA of RatAB toxin-antitoxin module|nr:SRPBCC family protein [Myxococcota bacterium]